MRRRSAARIHDERVRAAAGAAGALPPPSALGGLIAGSSNVIVQGLLTEVGQWRAVLPIVEKLIHPDMRTAQWQRIFALEPPEQTTGPLTDEAGDADTSGGDQASKRSGVTFVADTAISESPPANRRKKGMCLDTLWGKFDFYGPVIDNMLKQTVAKQVEQQAAKGAQSVASRKLDRQKKRQKSAERKAAAHGGSGSGGSSPAHHRPASRASSAASASASP